MTHNCPDCRCAAKTFMSVSPRLTTGAAAAVPMVTVTFPPLTAATVTADLSKFTGAAPGVAGIVSYTVKA